MGGMGWLGAGTPVGDDGVDHPAGVFRRVQRRLDLGHAGAARVAGQRRCHQFRPVEDGLALLQMVQRPGQRARRRLGARLRRDLAGEAFGKGGGAARRGDAIADALCLQLGKPVLPLCMHRGAVGLVLAPAGDQRGALRHLLVPFPPLLVHIFQDVLPARGKGVAQVLAIAGDLEGLHRADLHRLQPVA